MKSERKLPVRQKNILHEVCETGTQKGTGGSRCSGADFRTERQLVPKFEKRICYLGPGGKATYTDSEWGGAMMRSVQYADLT